MKQRILYLALLELLPGDGVSKKVAAQVKAFNKQSECHLCSYENRGSKRYIKVDGQDICEISNANSLLYRKRIFDSILKYINETGINVLYIRYTLNADYYYISFLKAAKRLGCKILIEIPTYPYDSEFKNASLKRKLLHQVEMFFRQWLRSCCDYIVTTSEQENIFNLPTLRISNAVDPDDIPLNPSTQKKESYRFIAVGQIAFWHGYDRMIAGFRDYYKNNPETEVYLDIVGNGHALPELQALVKDYDLEKYITFHGRREGAELNAIFTNADMAIGCLGCHRKSLVEVKSLKNVEYAMRGLPFIYSERNSDFDDKPYVVKCSPDESPVSVDELVNFIKQNTFTPEEIRKSVDVLSWDNQIKTILGKLNS